MTTEAPATLSTEATLVLHLLATGWKLHVPQNPAEGRWIYKQTKSGNKTSVSRNSVSSDCVIELHECKLIRKVRQFTVNRKTTVVYELQPH